jgi:hypothetical protein
LTSSVALRGPVAAGVKRRYTEQLDPGARLLPTQKLAKTEKSPALVPETLKLPNVTGAVPELSM